MTKKTLREGDFSFPICGQGELWRYLRVSRGSCAFQVNFRRDLGFLQFFNLKMARIAFRVGHGDSSFLCLDCGDATEVTSNIPRRNHHSRLPDLTPAEPQEFSFKSISLHRRIANAGC